jgi:hypothetical protein
MTRDLDYARQHSYLRIDHLPMTLDYNSRTPLRTNTEIMTSQTTLITGTI